ncbi:MAG: helix-turn-helix domain containing protein [Acidobacteria bacterium]|nr:helix-turn-helix domain containing protein [Acidobacteriota bacterium]
MKKEHIKLNKEDREKLEEITSKGKHRARVYKRAQGLIEMGKGKTLQEVSEMLGVSYVTISNWKDKYKSEGLEFLQDKKRPGRPPEIDGMQRAKITALACSQAPLGHARWDLRMLAEKVVELGYCEEISHTHVRNILKKTS